MGLSLAQPYLVNATIIYISFSSSYPNYHGYGLIGAYALCYLGIAVIASTPTLSISCRAPLTLLPVNHAMVHAHCFSNYGQDSGSSRDYHLQEYAYCQG